MKGSSSLKPSRSFRIALLAASLLATTPALAQVTTASIRGNVTAGATPTPGATVTARNVDTGFTTTATAGTDGSYVLTGLRPGTYDISVGGRTERVIISVGQNVTLDLDSSAAAPPPEAAQAGDILVVGTRLAETRTMEIGTNVTDDQIENLPQNNRNFINFAALAPGIRVLQTEFRQTFGGGGVGVDPNGDSFGGPQVNVFIDGVSLRSNINQGGIVGQDVSRGNPFSQLAVAEFRVLTSNFKAEYEDAGTSLITAITRSGTNEFHGEVFGTYQDESLIAISPIVRRQEDPEPNLNRYQFGGALGGPIMRDNLFFFGSYEGNIQDRSNTVTPQGDPARQAQVPFDLEPFTGTFGSPFREHLGFGKLTWQAGDDHLVELSGSARIESDLRDFGGANAFSRRTRVDNDVYTARLRWDWAGDGFLNEASVDWLRSDLAFGAVGDVEFGQIFQGVISIGGRADFQEVLQEGLTFRNNFSLTDLEWNGSHLLKMGVKLSFQDYRVGGTGPNANPQFEFVIDEGRGLDFTFPANVRFGGGNPEIEASTTQIGVFLQDDWEVNDHLLLNLGLRWDVDTNARNRNFVTSPAAAEALRALGADPRAPTFFDVEDYISTGDNREIDWDNFAPRVGFSYDINADQRTVIFGGYGRYYDRALFRSAAEETLLRQFRSGELLFSRDGLPRDGRPTIQWQDAFLTPEGFAALLASLASDPTSPGTSELRAIPNDLATPYTDQFSIGVRQRFGDFRTSLSFAHIIGRDQIGYAPLNRTETTNANGFFDFIPLINGFSNAVVAFNTRATRYDAIFLTIDKPYTRRSGWGVGLAYTYADSRERGSAFNFDFPNIAEQAFVPNAGDEEHRVVVNGIVDLPWGFRVSGLATYSSGLPYFIIDATEGFQPDRIRLGHFRDAPGYLQVDLRLQKIFPVFNGAELVLSAEVFNLFNENIWQSGDNFFGPDSTIEFRCGEFIGQGCALAGPKRSFQFGAAFRF
jgi:outer membrane receptor protein involved in Fe transport